MTIEMNESCKIGLLKLQHLKHSTVLSLDHIFASIQNLLSRTLKVKVLKIESFEDFGSKSSLCHF